MLLTQINYTFDMIATWRHQAQRFKPRRWTPYLLLSAFWVISTWNLSRFPALLQDEPWVLSPGYTLFQRGVFGSDLFAGLYGMDKHYLEFMPLMSVLQGIVARAMGVGVLQLRWLPVVLGTLTLALTFALASRLTNSTVGVLAMMLLLFWQWRPGGEPWLGSGIPLVDVARIARYDILVAPLALSALWAYTQARRREGADGRFDAVSGAAVGLAGLAHVYGAFWGGAMLIQLGLDAIQRARRPAWRPLVMFGLSLVVVWMSWMIWPLVYWDDFVHQQHLNRQYFDVWDPKFYQSNLVNEPQRYGQGALDPRLWRQGGSWLLWVGVLPTLGWASVRTVRGRDWRAALLLWPAVFIPAASAALIQNKSFNYLISIAPVYAILLAWALTHALQAWRPAGRLLAFGALGVAVVQGAIAIGQMEARALQAVPPDPFLSQLRQAVPPGGRILGTHDYWLALPDRDYRSFAVPIYLSDPETNPEPITFDAALTQLAPQLVLMDSRLGRVFADVSTPLTRARGKQFWEFMRQRHAHVIAAVLNPQGDWVQVYQLDW